ncbi:MAG: hypothetical protein J6A26_02785 [Oscillospiraceae bacterium]|nr:hypothetical protein [Oscillospiraceae bacterium]
MRKYSAIILADRDGSAFHSHYPYAMAEVLFQPLLLWTIDCCRKMGIEAICVLTRGQRQVEQLLEQEAVSVARYISDTASFAEAAGCSQVLVLSCERPLLDSKLLQEAWQEHRRRSHIQATVLTEKECPCGITWLDRDAFLKIMEQGEQVDLYNIATEAENNDLKVMEYPVKEPSQLRRAASRKDLLELNQLANAKVCDALMEQGVSFTSLDGVLVSPRAQVGADTVIHSGTQLKGEVSIGECCQIGPNTVIENSTVGDNTNIHSSLIEKSKVGSGVRLGPNSHLRPNSVLADKVKIGNFVEIKNSTLGEGTSVAHLTYIGDTDMGAHVNVGCGVVCVNYDGYAKYRCTVGDNVFIGCNTNLVAPVTVKDGAYTAAGSTITDEVPENALAIARSRQTNIEGWVQRHKAKYGK